MSAFRQRFVQRITGGKDGKDKGIYLTRILLTPLTRWGQIYLHVFHRGDADPDPHDHPWDFVTFPLRSYIEEVHVQWWANPRRKVKAFRFHYRKAEHIHRVMGPVRGEGKVITLVWHGPYRREWGFWVWGEWVYWKTYLGRKP